MRPVLFIWAFSTLLFLPIFSSFFFQDDFLLLNRTHVRSISDFLQLFRGDDDVIFYRPLSMGVFFWLAEVMFGKTYFWYKLFTLFVFGGNIFLISRIMHMLLVSSWQKRFVVFFYAINPAHFVALYWLSELNLLIGQLFFFAALLFGLQYLKKGSKRFLSFSFASFLLALASNEFALTFPFTFIIAAFLLPSLDRTRFTQVIISSAFLLGGYALMRLLLFPPHIATTYTPAIDFRIGQSLLWYALRAFGLPETFSVRLALQQFSIFNMFILLVIFLLGVMLLRGFSRAILQRKEVWVGGAWFVVTLLPILFLPEHRLASYVGFGLPGFALVLSTFLQKRTVVIFVGLFAAVSFFGIQHQERNHWVIARANISHYVLKKLEDQFPQGLPSRIIIADSSALSSEEIYFSLVGDHGVRFWFGDDEREVFYQRWNPNLPPEITRVQF